MSKDELVLLCRGKRGVEELSTARGQAKTGDDCHALWIFPLAALVAHRGYGGLKQFSHILEYHCLVETSE